MTNQELIKILKKLPKDAIIVIPRHSDADSRFHFSASDVELIAVCRNHDNWQGEYVEPIESHQSIPAISIS